jgi:hypothetical protein
VFALVPTNDSSSHSGQLEFSVSRTFLSKIGQRKYSVLPVSVPYQITGPARRAVCITEIALAADS